MLDRELQVWCQKVLPLTYDCSLSYYENLCKVVSYLNKMMQNMTCMQREICQIEQVVCELQKKIDTLDYTWASETIQKYIASMIFVEINETGRIVYNIPGSWDHIVFNTTGLDIELEMQPEYGHLVLSY